MHLDRLTKIYIWKAHIDVYSALSLYIYILVKLNDQGAFFN